MIYRFICKWWPCVYEPACYEMLVAKEYYAIVGSYTITSHVLWSYTIVTHIIWSYTIVTHIMIISLYSVIYNHTTQ